MERYFSWLSYNSYCMDVGIPSLVATLITSLRNSLSRTYKLASSKPIPFIKGGGKYFAGSCISRTRSAYWRMPTLKDFKISFWIYLTWSWKTLQIVSTYSNPTLTKHIFRIQCTCMHPSTQPLTRQNHLSLPKSRISPWLHLVLFWAATDPQKYPSPTRCTLLGLSCIF